MLWLFRAVFSTAVTALNHPVLVFVLLLLFSRSTSVTADPGGCSVKSVGLLPLGCWDCGF
jgi:hypothetical protein